MSWQERFSYKILPRLGNIMTAPSAANVSGGIKNWGTLGNMVDGDCVVAAYYHICMAKNTLKGSTLKKLLYRLGYRVPGTPFALEEYTAYLATLNEKPGPDQGVAVDGWLNWQQTQGNVTAWAALPYQASEAQVRQAMIDFGGVILGGELSQYAYNHAYDIWRYSAVDPSMQGDPNLGHAVAFLKYANGVDSFVSWGVWESMTETFRVKCFYSPYVFLLKSQENDPGYAAALAKIQALQTLWGV